jgi:hypothetical protein
MIEIGAGPWLLYGIGLAKVDGRPLHASQTVVTSEDAEALWRRLRIPQPVRLDPVSPYSYVQALVFGDQKIVGPSARIAWIIASSYNIGHRANRIALADPIIKTFRQQRRLLAIRPLNKASHHPPRDSARETRAPIGFSHGLGQKRRFAHLPATSVLPPMNRHSHSEPALLKGGDSVEKVFLG